MGGATPRKGYGMAAVAALATAFGMLVAGLSGPALAAINLMMDGRVVSDDVRLIDGAAYVKVRDVADAFGMVLAQHPGGFQLEKQGGATGEHGLKGEVGDVLSDGTWRFVVISVETPEAYTMKTRAQPDYASMSDFADFDSDTRVVTPKTGQGLVALKVRVVNGQNEKKALRVSRPDVRTALIDTEGGKHPPIAYDFEGGPLQSKELQPGENLDFVVLVSVPLDTQLKEMIFTLRAGGESYPGSDVRVLLGE